MVPDFVRAKRAVEQKNAARNQGAEHVIALEENPLMAGHEVGFGNQVAGADRLRSKPQVRDGHGARLFGVIDEVALRVVVGTLAYDLDGVLVRANGAISTQTVEHSANHV